MEIKTAGANLEAYQALANDGSFVKKDNDGEGVHATGKSGKLGQVSKWLAKRNAGDNRELKQQFLKDIRHTFGPEFANKVEGEINPSGRSPLSASKINRVFARAQQDFGADFNQKIGSATVAAEFSQFGEGTELRKLIQTFDPSLFSNPAEIDVDQITESRIAMEVGKAIESAGERSGSPLSPVEAAKVTRTVVQSELNIQPATPQTLADCFANGDLEGANDRMKILAQTVNLLSKNESIVSDGAGPVSLINFELEGLTAELVDQFAPLVEFGSKHDVTAFQKNRELSVTVGNFIQAKVSEDGSTFTADLNLTQTEESNLRKEPLSELTSMFQQMTTRLPLMMGAVNSAKAEYEEAKNGDDSDRESRKLTAFKNTLGELETVSTNLMGRVKKYDEVMQLPGFMQAIPSESRGVMQELATTMQDLNTRFQSSDSVMDDIAIFARTHRTQLPAG